MSGPNALRAEPTRSVLDRLHAEARGDRLRFLKLAPRILAGLARGRSFFEIATPESMKGCYIPVSREQGELLYLTARALRARTVVEFGTSFGISTIYLASALRDNGGGIVIGSEIEPSKCTRATANLEASGLAGYADVRLGDALETLRELPEPVDLLLLDGWKDLYLPVLELVRPRLRPGAVVLADNIFTFRKALRPYVEYVQSGANGFESTTLRISDGFEYSVYIG
ncbi:MAG: class I SAM-dependent methyltransferase [Deltaproteobacteria bacterium]|nr:MAG: class I SAM-dependent methyltransferase [Deltaproteobacteria bacterium]